MYEPALLQIAVDRLFHEAWPEAPRHPDLAACHAVAVALINIGYAAATVKKPAMPILGQKAAEQGRRFLKQLQSDRDKVKTRLAAEQATRRAGYGETTEEVVLREMDATERHIQALLTICRPVRMAPAHAIADAAIAAWRGTPGAQVSPSTARNGALCRFVTEALKLIGIDNTADAVRKLFGGRAARPRRAKVPKPLKRARR
ncbi:MAG TPA: hypothetical protein VLX85_15355 [Stellaceae bacterium]|nr:hypothetical protein [Stellaceae bacterium]